MTIFLYLLMRDHLPCGTVAAILQSMKDIQSAQFTNIYLEDMAEDYAAIIEETHRRQKKE